MNIIIHLILSLSAILTKEYQMINGKKIEKMALAELLFCYGFLCTLIHYYQNRSFPTLFFLEDMFWNASFLPEYRKYYTDR